MLTQEELLNLQKKVETIVKNAGKYALEKWQNIEAIQKGTSGDVVTETDQYLEQQIKKELAFLVENASFIGEEYGGEAGVSYVWVIDPIDGTKNYAHHMPSFCVQISLLLGDLPILGVIYDPVADHLFSSSKGNGATINGQKVALERNVSLEDSTIDIDFGGTELLDWKVKVFEKLARASYRTRISAARFAPYLLTGGIHAFVVVNPTTKIWDQAPRIILFQEAGFEVGQFEVDGHKVILASNGELFLKIKEIIMNTIV